MGHSLPVSEPPALFGSILIGLIGAAIAGLFGADATTAYWWGAALMIGSNFLIGAPINTLAFDALGFLLGRPISPIVGAKILGALIL
jgi:hypothetical protein